MRAMVAILTVPFLVGAGAEVPRVGAAPSEETAIAAELMQAARRDPCGMVSAALGARGQGKEACGRFRQSNGDLLVSVTLEDAGKQVEMLATGRRCPGRYVGTQRPTAKDRRDAVQWLDLTFTSVDERMLDFVGFWRMRSHQGEIGKGCGADVEGRIQLTAGGWRPSGPRREGCSQ